MAPAEDGNSTADSNSTVPEDERMQPSQSEDSDGDGMTNQASTRWEWLATAVVGLTVFTFLLIVVLSVLGAVTLGALSGTWASLLGLAVASSYAYALGEAYIRRRGGK